MVVGLYGALAAAKYHERATYHLGQARALTQALVGSGDLADHHDKLDRFRDDHYREYPRLSRIRLHWLWTGFHFAIAVYGLILVLITVLLS